MQDPKNNTNKEIPATDISEEEKTLLDSAGEDDEERGLRRAELDDRDDDGELLNEVSSATDKTGRDLDVPGSNDDDDMEDIGEEDEENNSYSQADTE
jgi:hypothetical protein